MNKKSYDFHKFRSYLIVFGLLTLSFVLVFGGLIFRSKNHPDYPLVFTDANNKLMFITKSNNSKNDIASIKDANIVYANVNTKFLLYTNNKSLYILDTTVGGVGKKIANNVITYGFSEDDKYVYYIDNDNDFYIFNRNDSKKIKISEDVNKIELIKEDNIIYNQNGNLVYQKVDGNKYNISDTYLNVELNADNRYILYSVLNEDLKDYYVYDISNNNTNKVLEGITKLYSKNKNYTKFIYTTPSTTSINVSNALKDEYASSDKNYVSYDYTDFTSGKVTKSQYEANQILGRKIDFRNQIRSYVKDYGKFGNDLYYKNNEITNLVASNINDLYYYDIKNQVYSYTTYSFENNVLDISDYKEGEIEKFYEDFEAARYNSMFFKSGNSNASMAYKNITSTAKVRIRNNSEYYLIIENNGYYDLYYSNINNKSLKTVGEIDNNLVSNKFIEDYADGYIYIKNVDDKNNLAVVSDGKTKTIAEDVNPKYIAVSEGKDGIYYLKITGENIHDLNLYNGIRTSKLASDIYSFMYINNDLIYVTKDFDVNSNTSDLYRLEGSRLTLIYKDIADWYSPLKDDLSDEELEEDV